MKTFAEFRAWLVAGLVTILISVGGYVLDAQADALKALAEKQGEHSERIAVLETLVKGQAEINKELKEIVRALTARD